MAISARTVGDVLLEHGTIDAGQLEQAISRQKATGQPLGQVLVESGFISRLDLASALAEQWSDAPNLVPMEYERGAGQQPFSETISFDAPTAAAGGDAAIGELRAYLKMLAAKLDSLEARSPGVQMLQERLVELRQMVTGLADWASGPELRIAELESRESDLRTELSAVSTRLDDLIAGLERTIESVESHASGLAESVDELTGRVDAAAGREQLD
ncbi:MAG: hypothetical protein FJW96_16070, partial [Actinobacteria bacterium]|nr:hypothetical protein [Actinomycetota bacterium]